MFKYMCSINNPKWKIFRDYCETMDTRRIEDIVLPPKEIREMIMDPIWKDKMKNYFKMRRFRHTKKLNVGVHLNDDHKTATILTHKDTIKLL